MQLEQYLLKQSPCKHTAANKIQCHLKPQQPNSPSDDKHTWSHDDATALLLSHPPEQKINRSQCARTLHIPGGNAGQTLKEYAKKQGLDVTAMERKSSSPPTRIRKKKRNSYQVVRFLHHPYQLQLPLRPENRN